LVFDHLAEEDFIATQPAASRSPTAPNVNGHRFIAAISET